MRLRNTGLYEQPYGSAPVNLRRNDLFVFFGDHLDFCIVNGPFSSLERQWPFFWRLTSLPQYLVLIHCNYYIKVLMKLGHDTKKLKNHWFVWSSIVQPYSACKVIFKIPRRPQPTRLACSGPWPADWEPLPYIGPIVQLFEKTKALRTKETKPHFWYTSLITTKVFDLQHNIVIFQNCNVILPNKFTVFMLEKNLTTCVFLASISS